MIFSVLLLAGCGKRVLFSDSKNVDEQGWNMYEKCYFDVEVEDTLRVYDFFVDVRNSVDYNWSNLFLFIHTTFPDGSVCQDTLECPLADVEGNWLGKRSGHYVSNRYYLSKGIRFQNKGTYRFAVGKSDYGYICRYGSVFIAGRSEGYE